MPLVNVSDYVKPPEHRQNKLVDVKQTNPAFLNIEYG